jgi:hypothetical protein
MSSTISSYFWYAYDRAAAATSTAVETVKNIKQEDVVNAAYRVKDATSSVIQTVSNSCLPVWNLIAAAPPPAEGNGEAGGEEGAEGWEVIEPGAPGGPRQRRVTHKTPDSTDQ